MSARCRPDRWSEVTPEGAVMIIDCDTCAVRGPACADCVVTVLLGFPQVRGDGDVERGGVERGGVELDGAEQAALAVLASSGLVPPLRLLAAPPGEAGSLDVEGTDPGSGGERATARTVSGQSPVPRRPGGRRAAG
jgi:hypothetical protein